jgi:hypothetical protein
MNDTETRRYEMFINVREFETPHQPRFPLGSLAHDLFARLRTLIAEIETHDSALSSGKRTVSQGGRTKAVARDELQRRLEAMSRTARSIAINNPGLENKFRAPRKLKDQELLSTARSFATDAAPLQTDFIQRGLTDSFLQDLAADIADFEQAINRTIQGRETHVAANAAIDDLIAEGTSIVRELDTIMRNIFADEPAALAAWLSASHVERAPRSGGKQSAPPAPPQP